MGSDEDDDNEMEKRAKFSSWGGKRDPQENLYYPEYQAEKRARFSSWGGKRSLEEDLLDEPDKRARFSSWGGKRSDDLAEFENEIEKRAKFSSWGGKRSEASDEEAADVDKRAQFSSWGGKRMNEEVGNGKRAKFSSWGGKRAKFSSWGGKRGDDVAGAEEKRARFSSWGGKREDEQMKRARFSSWGGKRTSYMGGKRKFSSWGGKRSDPLTKFSFGDVNLDPISEDVDKYTNKEENDLNSYDIQQILRLLEVCHQSDSTYFLNKANDPLFHEWLINNFKWSHDSNNWNGQSSLFERNDSEPKPTLDEACWFFGKYLEKLQSGIEEENPLGTLGKSISESASNGDESGQDDKVLEDDSTDLEKRGNRYPAIGGKRRTPFSSWGGKRSVDYDQEKKHAIRKRSADPGTAKSGGDKGMMGDYQSLLTWNHKRSPMSSKKNTINRFFTKTNVYKDGSWTAVLRPIRRGSDFYPWGGKRASS